MSARWEEPSALELWSIKGLAGHLVRATTGVEQYLDADPAPSDEPITLGAYYVGALEDFDLASDLNKGIRQRGEDMAEQGYERLLELQQDVAERLRTRLENEPADRKVSIFKGLVLLLDDYLMTRIVELSVHMDDLAVSIGVPTPGLPKDALDFAIDALVATGRNRHGDLAVLRALSRRERDGVDALRVL